MHEANRDKCLQLRFTGLNQILVDKMETIYVS